MQRRRGGSLPSRPRASGRVVAVTAAVVVLLGITVVLAAPSLGPGVRGVFADLIGAPLALAALASTLVATVRSQDRQRWAWGVLTAGAGCWLVAEAARAVGYLPAGAGLPPVDDLFYLLSMPFGIVALILFPGHQWRGHDRARSVLDAVTVAVSLLFIGRVLGLIGWAGSADVGELVAIAYPVGDVVMLSLALAVLMRTAIGRRVPVALLATAMASYVVGDSVYAVQENGTGYVPGTLLDLTWLASYLLVALAGVFAASAGSGRRHERYGVRRLPWLLVGVCVVGAAVVGVVRLDDVVADPSAVGCGLLVAVLLTMRQIWTVHDVTRLNAQLSRRARYVAQIAESVVDGIVVADDRGRVVFTNPAAASALGTEPAGLRGTSVVDLVRREHVGQDAVAELLLALQAGSVLVDGAASLNRRDGSELPVEVSVGPVEWDGQGTGVVMVFRDVTGRRAVERMKNEFMSVISHELRTPLTSIRGALAMLDGGMGGPLQPTGSRMVTLALQSSERLSRLINDILDVERLESGSLQLTTAPHDAAALVQSAVHEMSGMATPAGVSLVVGPTDGTVLADPDRVLQTLTNLVGNAVKFSPPGGSVVLSSHVRGAGATAVVEFSVRDEGRGIPVEKRDRIFDRFEQVDSSDARRHGGSGLGLAICRDIVALHGGRIWVVPGTHGVGSDFRFTLPVPPVDTRPGPVPPVTGTDARGRTGVRSG